MNKYDLKTVETKLEGRISKNPYRFECANGVVFTVNQMNDDTESYFLERGVEIYKLEENVYYTETVMSLGEFSNLKHVNNYERVN